MRMLLFAGGLMAALVALLVVDISSQNGKAAMAETPALITHKIVERRVSGSTKLSLIVEIPLVDGRIPFERELRDLSTYLFGSEKDYPRKFVTYYLPGMEHGEGAFAMGQYNLEEKKKNKREPKLRVFIRPLNLSKYPQYAKFAQQ